MDRPSRRAEHQIRGLRGEHKVNLRENDGSSLTEMMLSGERTAAAPRRAWRVGHTRQFSGFDGCGAQVAPGFWVPQLRGNYILGPIGLEDRTMLWIVAKLDFGSAFKPVRSILRNGVSMASGERPRMCCRSPD
jgi:hypothetical protein